MLSPDEAIIWQTGGCGVLAMELHSMTDYPLLACCRTDDIGEESVYHVGVLHPSGKMLDIRGLSAVPDDARSFSRRELQELFDEDELPAPYDPDFGEGTIEFADAVQVATDLLSAIGQQS